MQGKEEEKKKRGQPFLACGVPNLGLYNFVIDVDAAGGEFNTNGGFGFQAEFVFGES